MKLKLIVLFVLFAPHILLAQNQVMEGQISHRDEPVAFAHVSLGTSQIATQTDLEGKFTFRNLQKGTYLLQVSATGFQDMQQEVILDDSTPWPVIMELTPLKEKLQEVLLESKHTGLQRDTPYNLSIINLQGLHRQNYPNGIMGILRQEPGVNGAEMGQGIVKPFIRGLGFSRVVSIYQGNKLENHQWGADHGLGVNDLGIKAVEVIKGPASVLYGSGALGGVLITKDEDTYQKSDKLTGTISSGINSSSNGLRTTASLGKRVSESWYVGSDLGYEQHADYRSGGGRRIGNSRFQTRTLRLHTGIEKERASHKLSVSYNAQKLGIISDQEMDKRYSLATHNRDYAMQLPYQSIKDYLISYNQTTRSDDLNTYLHLSHHYNDRQEIESERDKVDLGLRQHHTFLNARVDLKKGKLLHQLGLQSSFIQSSNRADALEFLIPDSKLFESGFFYMGSLKTRQYYLQGALRFDYRKVTAHTNKKHFTDYGFALPGQPAAGQLSKHFKGFTGSLGITRYLGQEHLIKANLATGFRAPDLAELFSNGPHPGTSRFEKGNLEFNREQSYQIDLRYQFQSTRFKAGVSAFATRIDDYIFFRPSNEIHPGSDLQVWSYTQKNVHFHGFELEAHWKIHNRLNGTLSASLVRAQEKDAKLPLGMIPADNLNLGMAYSALRDNTLQISGQWQGFAKQNRIGFNEKPTSGYGLLNVSASKTFSLPRYQYIELALTIENILDQKYVNHLSILRPFDIPSTGRNSRAVLKYAF